MSTLLIVFLSLCAFVLITLVLIQRGKGGGLTGALGGMGGQSAFGTKAGDLFTRITIVVATVWILFCGLTVKLMSQQRVDDPTKGANFGVTESAPKDPTDSSSTASPSATNEASSGGDAKTPESTTNGASKPAGEASSSGAASNATKPSEEGAESR